jgi:hypothetical protein
LQVITQSSNGKGELREDFDIIVHDGMARRVEELEAGERRRAGLDLMP